MKYFWVTCGILLALLLQTVILIAQPPPGVNTQTGAQNPIEPEETPDTFAFNYHFAVQPAQEFLFADTLLGSFQQYDPIRQRILDYTHLGNLGSAHYPLMYESRYRQGFEVGIDVYDLYQFERSELRYFALDQAFTDVYYSQGPSQQDNYFKAQFARNFNRGVQFSLDYKRINNGGQYKQEAAQATSLNVGLEFRPIDSRYTSYFTFTSNSVNQEHNGGIDTSSLNDRNVGVTFNVPVLLEGHNVITRQSNRSYSYLQYYRLLGQKDSLGRGPKSNIEVKNELRFYSARYKFFDADPDTDDSFYRDYLTDRRGVRYLMEHRAFETDIALRFNRPRERAGRKVVDQIEVGLRYTLNQVDQEPLDTTINNLFAYGVFQLDLTPRINFSANAHLGLLAQATDYRLEGNLSIDYAPWGILKLNAVSQRYTPPLIQARHIITEQSIWENLFTKPIENTLSASLEIPKLNLTLQGRYHLLTNFIYYDTLARPQQEGSAVNILQFVVQHQLRWKGLGLESVVAVQGITGDAISLPNIYGKHSLWLEGKIFKKAMLSRVGVDVRYHTPYQANAFMPASAQFYLQNDLEVPLTPLLDAFLAFKVRSFRFMIKMEGINNYWTDGFIYAAHLHPYPYAYLRFGVRWMFLD